MGQDLVGKVAIVTGGAGGLGRAIVEGFVQEGASVVVADVDIEAGASLAEKLGPGVAFCPTDVADAGQVQHAVDLAVERFGGLHVMCNNAGIGGSLIRFLDDDMNDFHASDGSEHARRDAREPASGPSHEGERRWCDREHHLDRRINAGPGLMTYRATKAAVVHITKSTAIELARYGIRVNCVAPAHIPTSINAELDQAALVNAMQPLK